MTRKNKTQSPCSASISSTLAAATTAPTANARRVTRREVTARGTATQLAMTTLLATAALLSACSESSDDKAQEPDAGSVNGPGDDSPSDQDAASGEPIDPIPNSDAGDGLDPEKDAGPEPEADAGPEPEADAGPEPDSDAGHAPDASTPPPVADAGPESDSGTTDGAPPTSDAGNPPPASDPWSSCAASDSWQAEPTWPLTLEAQPGATYCATFNESRTLAEELAAKMQLRFSPGTYSLPANEELDRALPVCLRGVDGPATAASAGRVQTSVTPFDGSDSYSLALDATFDDATNSVVQVRVERSVTDGNTPEFVFDGTEGGSNLDEYRSFERCPGDEPDCLPRMIFDSCEYASGAVNLHRVELATGNIEFELRLGESFAGTEPGAYVRASGSYSGQTFDQTDYFKLIYHPSHHHFERTFVVLFDSPIDGVCGVEVTELERFGDDIPDQAFEVDCQLERLRELPVTSHELVIE